MPEFKNNLSPGHKKLLSLGVQLPLLPTTTVGSFPKSSELAELRYKVAKGVQTASELERKEKISTETWIREQERIGLDILVDGEMNRGDLVSFFARKIRGIEPGGTVRGYGNRYYKKPIIKQKLEWQGPITMDMWRFSQRMTHKPLKAIVTGPYTLMDWSFNEYYSSRETACRDLAGLLRKEITELVEAGAKIIQIDEPALAARPEEFSLVYDSLKEILTGIKSYIVLHVCYGDLSPVWEKMQRLPVDNFSLEMANSNFVFLNTIKKHPTRKDVSLGVLDSHRYLSETPQQIGRVIEKARHAIPLKQLWLAPDCGLKTRTAEEATSKLRAMVKAAAHYRQKTY